ncbi:jg9480 [Pararge aegeria aegeria]|uniref:Jg9480 protein n=1 Tax=Pararge aegeria aegeria TaxID=348720 RepID=A0A8S4RID8_9NEOP|nr:jg9480 [Pararge aegeria aegeria]
MLFNLTNTSYSLTLIIRWDDRSDTSGKRPGKDITHKLYSVSEGLSAGVAGESEGQPAHLTRSASVDAVHEGARGRLRSVAWRAKSTSQKAHGGSPVPQAVTVRAKRDTARATAAADTNVVRELTAAGAAPKSTATHRFFPPQPRGKVRGGAHCSGAGSVTRAAAPARAGAANRAHLRLPHRTALPLTGRRANDDAPHN